jgi:hypothetical protein
MVNGDFGGRMKAHHQLIPLMFILAACATTSGQKSARTPGIPVESVVDDPQTQRLVMEALDDVALGRGEYQKHLSVPFMIGPGLWGELLQLEPRLAELGTESTSVVPMSRGTSVWKMRSYLDESAVGEIGHHIKFRAVAEAFRGGRVRPATPQERKLFYAMTPLEIAGKALTVLCVQPDHRLAIYVEGGKLVWIDLISRFTLTP